jgi:glucosamine kinase
VASREASTVDPRGRVTGVLGVDGGQSGIRLRHSLDDRVVEVEGVSRLEGDTISAVADAVAEGWRRGTFHPADRVVLGLTTAPVDAAGCDRLCRLVGSVTGAPQVWLADDAVTSHAGALSLGWGVSVVAGTGVACLAVPDHGPPKIIGGHGYLLGDEGGGFWIGRQGLRAALRSADGRGPHTTLTGAAERRFGELGDLHVRLHAGDRPVNTIAQFAPDVLEAAAAGDAAANDIIDEAARELLLVARTGAAWAGGSAVTVPLALGGRLLQPGTMLRRRLLDLLTRARLSVAPRSADASALDGAIQLGLAGDPHAYAGLVHTWTEWAPA